MAEYIYEGRKYVESGEFRLPKKGEFYVNEAGFLEKAGRNFINLERRILNADLEPGAVELLTKIYVAVVGRMEDGRVVQVSNGNGQWSAIVGTDKQDVIKRAIEHQQESNKRAIKPTNFAYHVFVGTLTHEARTPWTYELVEL